MNTNKEWNEVLRLIYKFCPQSKSQLLSIKDLLMDNVYGVFRCVEPDFLEKRLPISNNQKSENLLREVLGTSIELETGRVVAVPDLGDFRAKPLICSAKSLIERVSEGTVVEVEGREESTEFIGGGDTLFVFESTGRMLMFDHDEHYCLIEPKAL